MAGRRVHDPLGPVLVAALLVGGCGTLDAIGHPRGSACGAWDAPNEVLTSFRVDRVDELRSRIPRLGATPELPADSAAVVVVFRGPLRDTEIQGGSREGRGALGGSDSLANVCVVTPGGGARLYPNVDLTGFTG